MPYNQKLIGNLAPRKPTQDDYAVRQKQISDHQAFLDQLLSEVDISSGVPRCPYMACYKKLPHVYPPKDKCGECGREFLVPEGFKFTPTGNGSGRRIRRY